MEQTLAVLGLGVLGLVLGSFAGAEVWRLRARQLVEDRRHKEEVDARELKRLKPLVGGSFKNDRSRCLDCGHVLNGRDLIPLLSWLSTRGTCRYCGRPIGSFEPLIELGVAGFFVLSYLFWPEPLQGVGLAQFALWLAGGVGLAILFAYDLKWYLLPDRVNFTVIGIGALSVLIAATVSPDPAGVVVDAAGAVAILSGIYLGLYLVSKGAWVGFGDVKLGLGLGLLLGQWQPALLALFLANLIGSLAVAPGMISGKISRTSKIPFGPFLILGFFIAGIFGNIILGWYFGVRI